MVASGIGRTFTRFSCALVPGRMEDEKGGVVGLDQVGTTPLVDWEIPRETRLKALGFELSLLQGLDYLPFFGTPMQSSGRFCTYSAPFGCGTRQHRVYGFSNPRW